MFGKMMNRYYYGKSGKGDFTKEDLPQNHWQLFWEMLRVRFSALFKLNLLYMVAWLPTIIVIGRAVLMLFSGLTNLMDMQAQADAGEITAEMLAQATQQLTEAVPAILSQTLVLLVPCIAITGPFTAGAAYVTRNWARDEHSFVWSDFWDAAKGNWKQALPTSIITGFVPLLVYVCYTFYGQLAADNAVFLLPQVICTMLGLLWMCSLMYVYPQMVTYDMRYGVLLRNSLIMAVGRLPMTVGLKLLSLVPTAICVVISLFTPYAIYALMVLGLYYILLGYALSRFVAASYTNAVFDRYLNTRIAGAQVGRGLYVDDDEDDEDESASESDQSTPV